MGAGPFPVVTAIVQLLASINDRLGGGAGEEVELPVNWLNDVLDVWVEKRKAEREYSQELQREAMKRGHR